MNIDINKDALSDGSIEHLLNLHLQEMYKYSPPESVHALDPQKLKDPSVTFWAARINGELAGCGALKQLTATSGEIKSMKTHDNYLRMGVAGKLLAEILSESKKRFYTEIYLETGSNAAFTPAIEMYKKNGFLECGPFGEYESDPFSKFFTKALD